MAEVRATRGAVAWTVPETGDVAPTQNTTRTVVCTVGGDHGIGGVPFSAPRLESRGVPEVTINSNNAQKTSQGVQTAQETTLEQEQGDIVVLEDAPKLGGGTTKHRLQAKPTENGQNSGGDAEVLESAEEVLGRMVATEEAQEAQKRADKGKQPAKTLTATRTGNVISV